MPILSSIGGGSNRGFRRLSIITSSLFSFTTHTFTSATKVGRFGQTLANFQSAYSSQTWASNISYFFEGRALGYQVWQVPQNGIYEIEVAGARGQNGGLGTAYGAIMRGRVSLTTSDKLEMVVGQVPGSSGTESVSGAAGGGGGSYVVYYGTDTPIVIAGGAGGLYSTWTGVTSYHNGQTRRQPTHSGYSYSPNTDGAQPSIGYGGSGYHAGGGGGLLGSGTFYNGRTISDSSTTGDGIAPLYTGGSAFNGGGPVSGYYAIGGNYSNYPNMEGGFGGGGGGHSGNNSGAGGGGYSGGHGGQTSVGGSYLSGLGGGSFMISTATNVATSDGQYDGSSTFNGSSITNLGSYNTASTGGGTGYGYIKITLIS